jgi:hypothetical protein
MDKINLKELSTSNLECWVTKYVTQWLEARKEMDKAQDIAFSVIDELYERGFKVENLLKKIGENYE